MFDIFGSDTLAALILVVFILQYRRIATFFNLLKFKLRPSVWSDLPRDELPSHILHLFDCAAVGMNAIGFQFVAAQWAVPINIIDPRPRMFADVYWHPEKSVLARVELAEAMTGQDTKVQFQSLFADGTALFTVNREYWASFPISVGILLEDFYAEDLAGQWQGHQDALARESASHGLVTDLSDAVRREAALQSSFLLEQLRQTGWVREESPGRFGFTVKGAWRFSGRMLRLLGKARKALARPYRHDPSPDLETARLAEMDKIAASLALSAQPLASWLKTGLFIVTLALSTILFGREFGFLQAAALLTVLVVHELGHLAAMWVFDYRNLSIFFLPFLGAAATGHKPHATPWQEAIVLLAGPLPGLLLACAAFQIPSEALPAWSLEFVRFWTGFSLILNLLNLLPVGVLDGGRLFELALLGRFPYARAIFTCLGVAAGLAYAVSSRSMVVGVAMILLMVSVPWQFRTAGIITSIRRKTGQQALDSEQALHALGLEFAQSNYGGGGSKGYMRRMGIARLAYPRLMQGVPGLGVGLGILASLVLVWLLSLVALAWAWQAPEPAPLMSKTAVERKVLAEQRNEQAEQAEAKRAWEKFQTRYAETGDPAAKWTLLDQHEEDEDEFDEAQSDWMNQQRSLLMGQLPEDHTGKLWHRLYRASPGKPGTLETLKAVITQLGGGPAGQAAKLDEDHFEILLEAYRRLVNEVPPDRLKEPRLALDTLWTATASQGHPLADQRSSLAAIAARMAFVSGQFGEAQTWMERYRSVSCADDERKALNQGWFLLDINHPDQAQSMAREAMPKAKGHWLAQWQGLAGWAEMVQGHPREADVYFQAALYSQASRRADNSHGDGWWLGLLSRLALLFWDSNRVDAAMLDHLAALQAYDPTEAAKLFAELQKRLIQKGGFLPDINSTHGGWGKAREMAHDKLLQALEAASKQ